MYVFSARPFENHLCERLPCLKIINNNNNNKNNNNYLLVSAEVSKDNSSSTQKSGTASELMKVSSAW
jgi:hypothetical protein